MSEEQKPTQGSVLRDAMYFAATSGFVAGNYAVVMQKPVVSYTLFSCGSSFVVGSCFFGVRHGLTVVRKTDDMLNTAAAGWLTGFLFGGLHGGPPRAISASIAGTVGSCLVHGSWNQWKEYRWWKNSLPEGTSLSKYIVSKIDLPEWFPVHFKEKKGNDSDPTSTIKSEANNSTSNNSPPSKSA